MIRRILLSLVGAMTLTAVALAADTPSTPTAPAAPTVRGWQLMSPQERAEMRAKMRAAATPEERAQLREQHHALMQERAKELGVTLPDKPLAMGGPNCLGRGKGGRWR